MQAALSSAVNLSLKGCRNVAPKASAAALPAPCHAAHSFGRACAFRAGNALMRQTAAFHSRGPVVMVAADVSVDEKVQTLRTAREASRAITLTQSAGFNACVSLALQKEAIKKAKEAVKEIILNKNCNPIIVRLAWHDSGSYDKVSPCFLHAACKPDLDSQVLAEHLLMCALPFLQRIKEFPQRGGANGSIRFYPEIGHAANAGALPGPRQPLSAI